MSCNGHKTVADGGPGVQTQAPGPGAYEINQKWHK